MQLHRTISEGSEKLSSFMMPRRYETVFHFISTIKSFDGKFGYRLNRFGCACEITFLSRLITILSSEHFPSSPMWSIHPLQSGSTHQSPTNYINVCVGSTTNKTKAQDSHVIFFSTVFFNTISSFMLNINMIGQKWYQNICWNTLEVYSLMSLTFISKNDWVYGNSFNPTIKKQWKFLHTEHGLSFTKGDIVHVMMTWELFMLNIGQNGGLLVL